MPTQTTNNYTVEGGPAHPVYIVNAETTIGGDVGIEEPVSVESADGALATVGTTTGAAVSTDAAGTLQQYLRGLVKLFTNIAYDATNRLRVSLYGKNVVDADTPVAVDASGNVKTSLQTAIPAGTNNIGDVDILAAGNALTVASALANGNAGSQILAVHSYAFNGTTWDRIFKASIPNTVFTSASGDTAVWTPTVGKRFVLKGVLIQVPGFSTSATSLIHVLLRDNTTTILGFSVSVPVLSAGGSELMNTGWLWFGEGEYMSTAINQALNVNLSAAFTSGGVRVSVMGAEI